MTSSPLSRRTSSRSSQSRSSFECVNQDPADYTCTEALTLDETPAPKKIARLFLVSDILHNSSAAVPNASSYRSHFQESLPEIFASLHITPARESTRA